MTEIKNNMAIDTRSNTRLIPGTTDVSNCSDQPPRPGSEDTKIKLQNIISVECSRCGACLSICPKHCINFVKTERCPSRGPDCLHCDRCVSVCPLISGSVVLYHVHETYCVSETVLRNSLMELFEGKHVISSIDVLSLNINCNISSFINLGTMDCRAVALLLSLQNSIFIGSPADVAGLLNFIGYNVPNIIFIAIQTSYISESEHSIVSGFTGCDNEPDVSCTAEFVIDLRHGSNNGYTIINNSQYYKQVLIKNGGFKMKDSTKSLKSKYNRSLARAQEGKFDVGAVCIYTVGNYGGALTSYAFYRMLMNQGYSTLLIERPLSANHRPALSRIYKNNPFPDFVKAKLYPDRMSMTELNDVCDTFIVGSDQMFHVNLYLNFDEWVTLDWIRDSKRKIAYAASFGHDTFTGSENVRAKMSYFMKKFDHFSVREESGVDVASSFFGVKADWVLDPVFMCGKEDYLALLENFDRSHPVPRVCAYILDMDQTKKKIMDFILQVESSDHIMYSEFSYNSDQFKDFGFYLTKGYVEDRLCDIKDANLVVTDSFHGLCTSIIFERRFVVIKNKLRGSTRFESLAKLLGIEDRIIESVDDLKAKPWLLDPPDYEQIRSRLAKERKRSLRWLTAAISDSAPKPMSDCDLFMELLKIQENRILHLESLVEKLRLETLSLVNVQTNPYLKIDDLSEYLHAIVIGKPVVFLSVKDTPGYLIKRDTQILLYEVGLQKDLVDKVWRSYAAVVTDGKIVLEELSDEVTLPVIFDGDIKNVGRVHIESKSAKCGNRATIMIDGKEYSVNHRGLNIVLCDPQKGCVIDSVCFDTHSESKKIQTIRRPLP